MEQLEKEILFYGQKFGQSISIKTIFFGGGTPSIISAGQYKSIFNEIRKNFNISPDSEISLEANPGTVTLEYLESLLELGFNRISFGLQSSNPKFLDLLGRIHDHFQSIQAIEWAKKAGFKNINLDLIFGLPDQSVEDWKQTLHDGIELKTQHISLYALGIEENTPLFDWVNKGIVENPDPDLAAEMYEIANNMLSKSGFECYEISNFYKKDEQFDFRCQHNLQYWRNQPYIGVGAGAHGYINQARYENVGGIGEYIHLLKNSSNMKQTQSPAIKNFVNNNSIIEMQETMMVGLRLVTEGVSIQNFQNRFGVSPLIVFKSQIELLQKQKLLEIIDEDIIRLTQYGRLLGNQVFLQFVD